MATQSGAQTAATTYAGCSTGGDWPSSSRKEGSVRALSAVSPAFHGARLASGVALAITDVFAFVGCVCLVLLLREVIWDAPPLFWGLWPILVSWLLVRLMIGLYPPFGMPQPEELRRSAATSALAM